MRAEEGEEEEKRKKEEEEQEEEQEGVRVGEGEAEGEAEAEAEVKRSFIPTSNTAQSYVKKGQTDLILIPFPFTSDHIETLFDSDQEAIHEAGTSRSQEGRKSERQQDL